jgi:hypothetical protein
MDSNASHPVTELLPRIRGRGLANAWLKHELIPGGAHAG